MAQDLLDRFTPLHNQPINAAVPVASLTMRFGHRAVKFVQGASRAAYFANVLSSLYSNTGLRVTLVWTHPAAAGTIQWDLAFERQAASIFDYSAGANFAAATTVTAVPAGANLATYTTVDFAHGTAIDNLLALESYRLSVTRRGDLDAVAQDVYLYRVFLQNLT
jgi:hypothetical protein